MVGLTAVKVSREIKEASEVMGRPGEAAAIYCSEAKLSKIRPVIFHSKRHQGRAVVADKADQGALGVPEARAAVDRLVVVAVMVALKDHQVRRATRVRMAQAVNHTAIAQPHDPPGRHAFRKQMTDFRTFFKEYVNGWVAAALVLPTAVTWKGMPVYEAQRSLLVTYTSLSCALILAFLFTSRAFIIRLSKAKSRIGIIGSLLVPFIFICATGYSGYKYLQVLLDTAHYVSSPLPDAMKSTPLDQIHDGMTLMTYYILTMVFAECAFFFMAIRDWRPSADH